MTVAVVIEMHACVGRDQHLCYLLFPPRHQHVCALCYVIDGLKFEARGRQYTFTISPVVFSVT